MISKQTKKILSLAMSITVSGSVIPALTTSAAPVFAEENKSKTEDNNEVKDNSQVKDKGNNDNEGNENNIKLIDNIPQSTTGQSVSLLDADENSDGIDLYANNDGSWTTGNKFAGKGSTVTIENIEFKLKDDKNKTVEISNGRSYDQQELILPEKITIDGKEYEVTSVGKSAFSNNINLKRVTLSKVTSVDDWGFQDCRNLESISLPKVTSLGIRAFSRCKNLQEISLPEVTDIAQYAFDECGSLESVNLPEITDIAQYAFNNCGSLESVSMPEITDIAQYVFNECGSLESVSLPKLESVGSNAFSGCKNLQEISLPEATNISSSAFFPCESLKSVNLPKLESVGGWAFSGCKNLTEISLPEATFVGQSAFEGCSSLESVSLPKVTSVNYTGFKGCESLKEISMPEATDISMSAFEECNNIKNAVVSDKLKDTTIIPSESIIKIKDNDNGDGYIITNIEKKSGDGKIILPSKIGEKSIIDMSDNAIEVIKNNEDKVEIDGRKVLNILRKNNVDISKMDVKNVTPGNKAALEEYYKQNSAAKYNKNNYPEDMYNIYEKSLMKADEVLKDKYASQEDIDSTLEALKNAVSELTKIDKNKLIELYGKYKDLKQGNYTSESYVKFTEGLKKAETVINNGNAVKDEIDGAFKNLQDAVNGLKEKSSDSGSGSSSSSSSSHRSSSSRKSSSEKTSESEVKSVESVTSEEPDNENNSAIQHKEGWNKIGESWIYVKNGVPATGWIQDGNGRWYYLNSAGIMQTGWIKDNERWYFLSQSGDMKSGWQYIDGAWYYLSEESDGYMGVMKTGWIYTGGKWYLLSESGKMKTGWAKNNGKWYYLNQDGSMAVNTVVDGYSIGADGAWL